MKNNRMLFAAFLGLSLISAPVMAKDPAGTKQLTNEGLDPSGEWEDLTYHEIDERKPLFWVGGLMCCVMRDIRYTSSNIRPLPGEPGYPWGFLRLTSVSETVVHPVPVEVCQTREAPFPGAGLEFHILFRIFNIPPILSEITEDEVEEACGIRPHLGLPWSGGE